MNTTVILFLDINECICGENAECVNTEGNYSCQCDLGFTGDGYNCTGLFHTFTIENLP